MKPKAAVQMGPQSAIPVTIFSSPAERFRASAVNIKNHQDMVDADAFDLSATVALAEYATKLAKRASDPNGAMGAGFQLRGAVDLLKEFRELAEQSKLIPKRIDTDNLQPIEPPRRP